MVDGELAIKNVGGSFWENDFENRPNSTLFAFFLQFSQMTISMQGRELRISSSNNHLHKVRRRVTTLVQGIQHVVLQ